MKITDDLTKKLAKTVAEIMQSAEVKDATRSKKEEEFLKLHLDNVSTVDLSPDEKPFQDPPKQKEEKQPKAEKVKEVKPKTVKESVLMEEAVKSDQWIEELANVLARSPDTKDLTMAFEGWVRSLVKTPGTVPEGAEPDAEISSAWKSIQRAPIIGNLVNRLGDALDVYTGYSVDSSEEGGDSQEGGNEDKVKENMEEAYKNFRNRERNAGEGGVTGDDIHVITINGKVHGTGNPIKAIRFPSREAAERVAKSFREHRPHDKFEVIPYVEEAMSGTEKQEPVKLNDLPDDVKKIVTDWKAASDKKSIISKNNLSSGMSALRGGAVKLGISNQLNGKKFFPALDTKGELIVIGGTSQKPKVIYSKDLK